MILKAQAQNLRYIKTYVSRCRTSKAQQRALDQLSAYYLIKPSDNNIANIFSNPSQNLALEIGFGMGENLIHNALNYQQLNWIGVETYASGVGRVMNLIKNKQIDNIKLYYGDIQDLLHLLAPQSLKLVQIFFPDPWPKKRHHKRRLIQKDFIIKLSSKMTLSAKLEIATDWQNYAQHIGEIFAQSKKEFNLTNLADDIFSARSENRILTNFEKKALKAERKVYDFCYLKQS